MPKKSWFAGFDPPNDLIRWNLAQLQAHKGELVLLSKVFNAIKSPFDMLAGDIKFKHWHRIADIHRSKANGWLDDIHFKGPRAPIVHLGYRKFTQSNFEGEEVGFEALGPGDLLQNKKMKLSRKIVAIGSMDENWGWLSTYFLNRTVPWATSFTGEGDPLNKNFQFGHEQIKPFLDDPNLIMLVVSQHHNVSHPKVISMPLGLMEPRDIWATMMRAARNGVKKNQGYLLYSAGSNYAYRPKIRNCIKETLKDDMNIMQDKIEKQAFRMSLVSSIASLSMPGLGYDTYRLWETLILGSMPVQERGMGFDRTVYRLPVLLVDDYADLTSDMIRSAYVEALYRADDWEYERLTKQWWERLIFEVAEANDHAPLLAKHPMLGEDLNFTRPMVPFDCEKMGGCGPGTKRVPKRSCAIFPERVDKNYDWRWEHHDRGDPSCPNCRRRRLLEDDNFALGISVEYSKIKDS